MKNKTSRVNKMKLKKAIVASLAIFILLAFTGCGTSSSLATTEHTKQENPSKTDSNMSAEPNEKLNDLFQQENQIFANHKNVWDKAFDLMSKNIDGDPMNEDYADFLANTIESHKDSFSKEEYVTLSKDIKTIRGIEEEIAKLEKEIATSASSSSSSYSSADSAGVFHGFKGKDLDGNDVDESLFSKNKVTVVNFWFSGCKPCVEELSKLNELNDKIKKSGRRSCWYQYRHIKMIIRMGSKKRKTSSSPKEFPTKLDFRFRFNSWKICRKHYSISNNSSRR